VAEATPTDASMENTVNAATVASFFVTLTGQDFMTHEPHQS
jgi:hypothetical protein